MTVPAGRVFLIPHTHWDREWYRTAAQFGARLEAVIDEVLDRLDDPDDLPHFLLDGQAIVVEDYLARRPDATDRVRAHVAAGRLALGPWYVLQDEFLVSGESTVRNLLLGEDRCAALGGRQRAGYVPDAFGHVAQLPQILAQAGIDTFVFTRGSGDELAEVGSEFLWEAPDGSTVTAVKQVGGYCNGGALGYRRDAEMLTGAPPDLDLAVERIGTLLDRMSAHARTPLRLVTNGCDHLPPQRDLAGVLGALREAYPDLPIEVTALDAYLDALGPHAPALARYRGELRGGAEEHLLPGVLSARVPIKQANDRCEQSLAGLLEPLLCLARVACGRPYPRGTLDRLWRTLLSNHPHDSICGCSIDAVHREMAVRFTAVDDGIDALLTSVFADLEAVDGAPGTYLTAFNPLPVPRRDVVERTVLLPPDLDVASIELVDRDGAAVPFAVVRADRMERVWGPAWQELPSRRQRETLRRYRAQFPQWFGETNGDHDLVATIQYEVQLPALGTTTVQIKPRDALSPPATHLSDSLVAGPDTLENAYLRVTMSGDGCLAIEDKRTGARYEGLNRLEDAEDAGDCYDFAPCEESHVLSTIGMHGDVDIIEDTGLRATLETDFTWRLPRGLTDDRRRRDEETVACPVRVRAELRREEPFVRVTLEIDNRARDHRLRILMPTGIEADTVVSEGAFHLDRRPIDVGERPHWCQPPTDALPQRGFSLVSDGSRGIMVMTRGLHELAATRLTDGTARMEITALRSVGWLARHDLVTRDRAVGPIVETPDAQCLGPFRTAYAIAPLAGAPEEADLPWISARFRSAPLVRQSTRPAATTAAAGLVTLESAAGAPTAAVTAIKPHRTRDTVVLRLFNWTATPLRQSVRCVRPVAGAWYVDLLEERTGSISTEADRIDVDLAPHRIVTVELALA